MGVTRWVSIAVLAAACNAGNATTPVADSRLLVSGDDMGPQAENVTLTRGGEPVRGAAVTANGVVLVETQPGQYQGQLADSLPVGATILLRIYAGVDTVTGSAIIPAVPALTAPMSTTTIVLGATIPQPVAFTWTSPSSPDEFLFGLDYDPSEALAEVDSTAGSARSGSVGTGGIPVQESQLIAFLVAYSNGTFTGNAHPASRMHVRELAPEVIITPSVASVR